MMTPVGRFIVAKTAPREDLLKAINYITMPAALAPLLGPSVGGFIVTYSPWPWIFLINVPIGIVGVLLVLRYIPDVHDDETVPLDVSGFLFAGIGLASMTFGFESMGRGLLSTPLVITLIITGAICALLYIRHARKAPNPIIDLSLLRFPAYTASLIGGGLFYMGTTSSVFLMAILLQVGFGLSAFHAGLTTLATACGTTAARFLLRPILEHVRFKDFLITNAAVTGSYLIACGFLRVTTPYPLMIGLLLIGGLSRSLQFTAVTSLAYAEIPHNLMSRATSFSAMMQQFAQSFGVSLAALIAHFSIIASGRSSLTISDIMPAYFAIGIAAILSTAFFSRLSAHIGEDMGGGHRRKV
jgi:hypothetical protein